MKFRKKPVVIEAEQFFRNKKPWPIGVYFTVPGAGSLESGFHIDTLEGKYNVSEGDWIITGIKDERYPCKPDIFEVTYEKVEEVL